MRTTVTEYQIVVEPVYRHGHVIPWPWSPEKPTDEQLEKLLRDERSVRAVSVNTREREMIGVPADILDVLVAQYQRATTTLQGGIDALHRADTDTWIRNTLKD